MNAVHRIAVYDLDRTLLRRPTFTLFLLWAAWTGAPWRLLLTPLLLLAGAGHALHLFGRDRFKPIAIRLMLGSHLPAGRTADLAERFAAWRVPADVPPGARARVDRDRAEGYRLLMATAAPEFYAGAIAATLGFDAVVASRHRRNADSHWLPALDGPNCYGAEKARRVAEWLDTHTPQGARHIRFYSDHPSDAPTFALADEAWLVGRGEKLARLARKNGWHLADFETDVFPD
ncbi:MAG: HAD-IB family phosphatase [Sphingopyxis sp.]|uniref:HAD-IB family phosphatase n=1 Tax=Sphingopyxis sp. TaxID=1908224 RepID=UPI002ABABC62|nr:HAD-IB family phosphatase [Sphingopyxis sp.]MDZ3830283.1 HAD-IB family phosphatase [Sphingopyxis sp.]